MSRNARFKSPSGLYHVITRGIGQQILFENDNDRRYYMEKLTSYREELCISLYCYCLMENHVHLLVHDYDDSLHLLMKKIGVSYAQYYNHKYNRCGYLFQDRYGSEVIDSDSYFETVLRYIIKNPQAAGICRADRYRWSSYNEYAGDNPVYTDIAFAVSHFKGLGNVMRYLNEDSNDECLDIRPPAIDDEQAIKIIQQMLTVSSGTSLQNYSRTARDRDLRILKEQGLSIRQIARLTGISPGVVQRA